jgi:hypothetical protein
MTKVDVDLSAAHIHFSAWCFNQAWNLIEKSDRTEADDRLMVAMSQASIFHWLSRPDCTDRNLSIGYWQASRIQALLGNAAEAKRHAQTCLGYSAALEPFYLGYAYEALARAAGLAKDSSARANYLSRAEAMAAQVSKAADRQLLMADLKQLRGEMVEG